MRKLLLAAACAVALCNSAVAADRPVPYKAAPMAPAPVFSWTGFYFGAHIGYGWSDTTWCREGLVNGCADRDPGENFARVDPKGILGGVQAGYNVQAGQFVYGIEGDFSGAGLKGDAVFRNFNTVTTAHTDKDWLADIAGRLGIAFDRGLLYAKGGVAWVGDEHFITSAFGPFSKTHATPTGWLIGAGYEYAFANGWSWKIEYNFLDFGKHDYTIAGAGAAGGSSTVTIDQNIHVVKIGLNYRFGGDPWGKAPVTARY